LALARRVAAVQPSIIRAVGTIRRNTGGVPCTTASTATAMAIGRPAGNRRVSRVPWLLHYPRSISSHPPDGATRRLHPDTAPWTKEMGKQTLANFSAHVSWPNLSQLFVHEAPTVIMNLKSISAATSCKHAPGKHRMA
jgi:hypothetical protein